jgi:hypothetical protein
MAWLSAPVPEIPPCAKAQTPSGIVGVNGPVLASQALPRLPSTVFIPPPIHCSWCGSAIEGGKYDRLSKQMRGISAALSAFGAAYGKRTTVRKISAAD